MSDQQELEALRRDADAEIWRERARQELAAQMQAGTHRLEDVDMWAHCGNGYFCDDGQKRTKGVKIITNRTYMDGDPSCAGEPIGRMIENTFVDLAFSREEDSICERCGEPSMQLSLDERPVYGPLSGHDPRGLVDLARKMIGPNGNGRRPSAVEMFQASKPEGDDRVASLEKQLEDLSAQFAETVAKLTGQAPPEAPVKAPAAASPAKSGVKGYRKRSSGYEALLYRSESPTGKQKSLGVFPTVDEAIAARERALS